MFHTFSKRTYVARFTLLIFSPPVIFDGSQQASDQTLTFLAYSSTFTLWFKSGLCAAQTCWNDKVLAGVLQPILDLGRGWSIAQTDVARTQSIQTWSRSLWEMMGLRVGLGGGKKPRKELVLCTNFATTSITPLTQPSHPLPLPWSQNDQLLLVTNHRLHKNKKATKWSESVIFFTFFTFVWDYIGSCFHT